MPKPRRSLVLLVPAAILLGLAALLAGRFWLAPDPEVPSFSRARAVAFPTAAPSVVRAAEVPHLAGHVLDPAGEPVIDAIVYARIDGVPVWTRSAADGSYDLTWPRARGVERDRSTPVELVVVAWGFPPGRFEVAAEASPFRAVLTARLESPTPVPPELGSRLAGSLVRSNAPEGERAFEYEVVLLPATPVQEFGGPVARRVRCAPDGSFALDDLAHGSYRVQVLPAWASSGTWPDVLAPGESELEHPAPDAAPVLLGLSMGAVHGIARDASGKPVEGALALLVDAANPARLWPPASSADNGSFSFQDLPAGPYLVSIQAGEARIADLDVEVAAGAQSEVALPALQLRGE